MPPPSPALPQSEDPDYKWVLTVMGFWLKFFGGLLGLVLSVCWVLQIILYILIDPPVTPLLNSLFIKCAAGRGRQAGGVCSAAAAAAGMLFGPQRSPHKTSRRPG